MYEKVLKQAVEEHLRHQIRKYAIMENAKEEAIYSFALEWLQTGNIESVSKGITAADIFHTKEAHAKSAAMIARSEKNDIWAEEYERQAAIYHWLSIEILYAARKADSV